MTIGEAKLLRVGDQVISRLNRDNGLTFEIIDIEEWGRKCLFTCKPITNELTGNTQIRKIMHCNLDINELKIENKNQYDIFYDEIKKDYSMIEGWAL